MLSKFKLLALLCLTSTVACSEELDEEMLTEIATLAQSGSVDALETALAKAGLRDVSRLRVGKGLTLAHIAAINKTDPDVMRVLAARGADLNALNDAGKTPLVVAFDNNHAAAAQRLLELGADPYFEYGSRKRNLVDVCRTVVLRDIPSHETCRLIDQLAGKIK